MWLAALKLLNHLHGSPLLLSIRCVAPSHLTPPCSTIVQVLAVAPSNVAVDNIVERLAVQLPGSAPRVLRIGHPARMTPAVLKHCLDAKIQVQP
jgi:ATP-dependent RNA/DNA helicase IGHMBP2